MKGRVYFIQAASGGPIKIGYSTNVEGRLQTLQIASSQRLELLVSIPGSRATEAMIHHEFRSGRLEGEWFREDTRGLDQLIEDLINPDFSNPLVADVHEAIARAEAA